MATLRSRWDRGGYLGAYAARSPWTPVSLPVKAPAASDVLDRFDETLRWVERFRRDSHTSAGRARFRVEHRTIRGRNLGANDIPARIWIDSFEQLCVLLGTVGEVRALDALVDQTRALCPDLLPWVVAHPRRAVEHKEVWTRALATVTWIAQHQPGDLYLRQIDVEGVDTKFVERHARLLDELLAAFLPSGRVDLRPGAGFAARHGFRSKPDYVRFRLLSPDPRFPPGITELRLRADELAVAPPGATRVFVVENEITYLAFPPVPDAIVIFGSGYALSGIRELPWLERRELVYWGDIDTHGFAILSNLRSRLPAVASMLMDHRTLLAHPLQWSEEATPTGRSLSHLTGSETDCYHDLVEDRYGRAVRLEQERVRFSLLEQALEPWC